VAFLPVAEEVWFSWTTTVPAFWLTGFRPGVD